MGKPVNMGIYWLLSLVCMSASVYACLNGWVRYDNSCYHLSHDKENWADAMTICKLDDGVLAVITSARENAFLEKLMANKAVTHYWIGANDLDVEGDWVWWPSRDRLTYSNWNPGEPNSKNVDENCGEIYTYGKWNDSPCTMVLNYICERPYDGSEIVG